MQKLVEVVLRLVVAAGIADQMLGWRRILDAVFFLAGLAEGAARNNSVAFTPLARPCSGMNTEDRALFLAVLYRALSAAPNIATNPYQTGAASCDIEECRGIS